MGMISAAVEAVTVESTEANAHSGRRNVCNCLPMRTTITLGPWPRLASSLLSHSPQWSNSYHEFCKPPRSPNPTYSYNIKKKSYAQTFLPKLTSHPPLLLCSWHWLHILNSPLWSLRPFLWSPSCCQLGIQSILAVIGKTATVSTTGFKKIN